MNFTLYDLRWDQYQTQYNGHFESSIGLITDICRSIVLIEHRMVLSNVMDRETAVLKNGKNEAERFVYNSCVSVGQSFRSVYIQPINKHECFVPCKLPCRSIPLITGVPYGPGIGWLPFKCVPFFTAVYYTPTTRESSISHFYLEFVSSLELIFGQILRYTDSYNYPKRNTLYRTIDAAS